jgi:hypothetical protein
MAGFNDRAGGGGADAPDDDKQDVIRRALERLEQLKDAPRAPQSLRDRILSELGVDDNAGAKGPSADKDE